MNGGLFGPPSGITGASQTLIDIQEFTSSGTWTKPAWADSLATVEVYLIGGGGGNNNQSAGGSGGGLSIYEIIASILPDTASVTVAAGGAANSGIAGQGGTTDFGGVWLATGGSGGVAAGSLSATLLGLGNVAAGSQGFNVGGGGGPAGQLPLGTGAISGLSGATNFVQTTSYAGQSVGITNTNDGASSFDKRGGSAGSQLYGGGAARNVTAVGAQGYARVITRK